MPLTLHSWGAYPAYDWNETPYREDDFRVNTMVRAIKGTLSARQYNDVLGIDGQTYRITAGHEQRAFLVFAKWAVQQLTGRADLLIVPVPASNHTDFGIPFTGSSLAQITANVAPRASNIVAAPILAFNEKMPKASAGESGGRDRVVLENGLKCSRESLESVNVVLVDDVCTTGAHLIASARFLRAKGAIVNTALCVGRTVNYQHPTPLQVQPEDLEEPPINPRIG